MYFNKKSKAFLLLSVICFFCKINAQSQGCIDTIVSKKIIVENFSGTMGASGNYQDNSGNYYYLGNKRWFTIGLNLKSSLTKFNEQKQIIWSKSYNSSLGNDDFAYRRLFMGVDNADNLYYSSVVNLGSVGRLSDINFLKLDSNGSILGNKLLSKTAPVGNDYFNGLSTGKIFSTIISSYLSLFSNFVNLAGTEKNLSAIRWSKSYKPNLINFITTRAGTSTEVNDSIAIIPIYLVYKNPLNTNDTIYSYHFLKINSLTGNIIQQKAYRISDQQNPSKSINTGLLITNIKYTSNQIIYQFRKNTAQGDIYSFLTIDSNLNIISAASYQANVVFNTSSFNNLDSNNIILNGNITQNGRTTFSTICWDTNLQLVKQKSYYSSQFTGNALYESTTYKNADNTFCYYTTNAAFFAQNDNPIYFFDNKKNPNFESDCSDKDVQLFQPAPDFNFTSDASFFTSQPGLSYILRDNPHTYTAQNNNFSEEKYCDLLSICTSLKIHGKSSFCLNNGNIDSFKVIRNSTCLRKTKWAVDNNQMQILQSTDTSVKVKFLQPFKGYIKATYENCSVADSFYVEVDTVYNVKSTVDLGPDTIQCIGKSITLNAGNGFKKYEWQNGSTLNTFTTSDTGLFHIKVTDSCNNVFRDSVRIFTNSKKLNLVFGNTLCEYDTAKIILPSNFTNYTWQPLSGGIVSGNALLFFPTSTTIYTVSAESHDNCFLEDTVLIKKKDCFGSMYFPNAFSPNNDGINDNYKPTAVGILQSYSFTVYNRYGNIVFRTTDIKKGWNGKYKDRIQSGGYTWVCTYLFRNRKTEVESGSFVLLQ